MTFTPAGTPASSSPSLVPSLISTSTGQHSLPSDNVNLGITNSSFTRKQGTWFIRKGFFCPSEAYSRSFPDLVDTVPPKQQRQSHAFPVYGPRVSLNTPTHSYPRTFALPEIPSLAHPSNSSIFFLQVFMPMPLSIQTKLQPASTLPLPVLAPALHTSHSVFYVFVCHLLPPLFKLHEGRLFVLFPAVSPASRTVLRGVAGAQQFFAEQMHEGMYK